MVNTKKVLTTEPEETNLYTQKCKGHKPILKKIEAIRRIETTREEKEQ